MGRERRMREEGSGEDVKAKNNKNEKVTPSQGGEEYSYCTQASSKDQASRAGLLAATYGMCMVPRAARRK